MSNKILLPTLLSILIGCYINVHSMESANKPQIISKYNNNNVIQNNGIRDEVGLATAKYYLDEYIDTVITPFIHESFDSKSLTIICKHSLVNLLHNLILIDYQDIPTISKCGKAITASLRSLLNGEMNAHNKKKLVKLAKDLLNVFNGYAFIKLFAGGWDVCNTPSSITTEEELNNEVNKLLEQVKQCDNLLHSDTIDFANAILKGDIPDIGISASRISFALKNQIPNHNECINQFKQQFLKVCKGYTDIKFVGKLQELIEEWNFDINDFSISIKKLKELSKFISETVPNNIPVKQEINAAIQKIINCISSRNCEKITNYQGDILIALDDLNGTQYKWSVEDKVNEVIKVVHHCIISQELEKLNSLVSNFLFEHKIIKEKRQSLANSTEKFNTFVYENKKLEINECSSAINTILKQLRNQNNRIKQLDNISNQLKKIIYKLPK